MEIPVSTGFAVVLEEACQDFEVLLRLLRGEIVLSRTMPEVSFHPDMNDLKNRAFMARNQGAVMAALAKSFLFGVARANRICKHGANSLGVERSERTRFLRATDRVISVRDVNEHGFDAASGARGKTSKPAMHAHTGWVSWIDETSIVFNGDTEILMGPLNLIDLYTPTDRMRKLVGFEAHFFKLKEKRFGSLET